ncbi:VOC family protein [Faecalispora anaeroviscerum]|uniref:VOC family protein n=1 Tax=Faecalispora anaeroviscerum TaxID=2991836 RepID=UPI0024B8A6C7|nr:VOC family protein [Faecalispora anaeroviscerum]
MNTKGLLPIALDAVVLECKDMAALSDFYIRLLGWKKNYGEEGEWTDIISPSGGVKIAFQQNEDYITPVWPDEPGAQQQMTHLDFTVHNQEQLELAVQHAVSCGAVKASVQYDAEKWITMIDPAGHPFCFVIWL